MPFLGFLAFSFRSRCQIRYTVLINRKIAVWMYSGLFFIIKPQDLRKKPQNIRKIFEPTIKKNRYCVSYLDNKKFKCRRQKV